MVARANGRRRYGMDTFKLLQRCEVRIKMQVNQNTVAALCAACDQAFTVIGPAVIVTAEDNKPVCDRCASVPMIEARDEINSTPLPARDPHFFGSDFMADQARGAARIASIEQQVNQFNKNMEARYE